MTRILIISYLLLLSCMGRDDASVSGADDQMRWFKSPEQIKETLLTSFCLEKYLSSFVEDDASFVSDYISTIGSLYGNPSPHSMRTELQQPNGAYLLALDIVTTEISKVLLQAQRDIKQVGGTPWWLDEGCVNSNDDAQNRYLFNGTRFTLHTDSSSCEACYADPSKAWCDCKDDIQLGQFDKTNNLTPEMRKRIMHNIQDLGDFLGVPIDNNLILTDGSSKHVPQMLLEEVFIPALGESCSDDAAGNEIDSKCKDYNAWQQVMHALLLSGPFFLNLN